MKLSKGSYVLVLGAFGAIGQFVVRRLKMKYPGVTVVGITRTQPSATLPPHGVPDVTIQGDLCSENFCHDVFRNTKFDAIIHCAARWNGRNADPSVFVNNLNSMIHVLTESARQKAHFVYLSSAAVYTNAIFNDTAELCRLPEDTYGQSKLLNEVALKHTSTLKGFTYTIYRPFHIVSPTENYQPGTSHIFTDFYQKYILGGQDIGSDILENRSRVPFLWVEDFARILVDNLTNSKFEQQTFNVGAPSSYSVGQLAGLLQSYKSRRTAKPLVDSSVRPEANAYFDKIISTNGGNFPCLDLNQMVSKFLEYRNE